MEFWREKIAIDILRGRLRYWSWKNHSILTFYYLNYLIIWKCLDKHRLKSFKLLNIYILFYYFIYCIVLYYIIYCIILCTVCYDLCCIILYIVFYIESYYTVLYKSSHTKKFVNRSDEIPKQDNGFDCGVFTIVCADYLLDNLPLNYSQANMEFWREKIAIDILRGRLRYWRHHST